MTTSKIVLLDAPDPTPWPPIEPERGPWKPVGPPGRRP